MKKPTKKNGGRIDSPIAFTLDGKAIVNASHLDLAPDLPDLVRQLVAEGHAVFVGIGVGALRAELLRGLEDGAADVVGRLGPRVRLRTVRSRR